MSNGVQAFREPVVPAARKTLTIIVLTLIGLLGGIATLVYYYGISATNPGQPGYQSVLSLVDRGGGRQGHTVRSDDVLRSVGALSLREHLVCGLSAACAAPWRWTITCRTR